MVGKIAVAPDDLEKALQCLKENNIPVVYSCEDDRDISDGWHRVMVLHMADVEGLQEGCDDDEPVKHFTFTEQMLPGVAKKMNDGILANGDYHFWLEEGMKEIVESADKSERI